MALAEEEFEVQELLLEAQRLLDQVCASLQRDASSLCVASARRACVHVA